MANTYDNTDDWTTLDWTTLEDSIHQCLDGIRNCLDDVKAGREPQSNVKVLIKMVIKKEKEAAAIYEISKLECECAKELKDNAEKEWKTMQASSKKDLETIAMAATSNEKLTTVLPTTTEEFKTVQTLVEKCRETQTFARQCAAAISNNKGLPFKEKMKIARVFFAKKAKLAKDKTHYDHVKE